MPAERRTLGRVGSAGTATGAGTTAGHTAILPRVLFVGPVAYPGGVPRYEYRCRACGETFENSRPMSEASAPATCPHGHTDTVKLLSTVALSGRSGAGPAAAGPAGGGGCCGGACGCG